MYVIDAHINIHVYMYIFIYTDKYIYSVRTALQKVSPHDILDGILLR